MNRIDRLTGIILLLQSHRVITAERIAAHYEISVRTVYRDLAALGEAGVPIIAEAGMGYSLMRGYHVPPVMFTGDEAAALFLSGKITEQVADRSLQEALRAALLKIRSVLPAERQDDLDRLSRSTGVWLRGPVRDQAKHQALMRLQEAVVRRRCTALRYNAGDRGEITLRTVEPLAVLYYARQWHLIAYCQLRQAIRDFRLDRLIDWEVQDCVYEGHEDFSVDRFIEEMVRGRELVPATFLCSQRAVEQVRNEFLCVPSEEAELKDGRIRIDTLVGSLEWLTGWVLGFGGELEVLFPEDLRERVRAAALEVVARHQAPAENKIPLLT